MGAAIFRSRKGHDMATRHAQASPLQWGRDLSIAESQTKTAVPAVSPLGFNGAAIFRSRKGPNNWLSDAPLSLQWGRDLSIAERLVALSVIGREFALQWGRDLSIAERSSP